MSPSLCSPPAKRCHTLNPPSHGSLLCSNPHEEFSFGSWCNITCDDGFVLNGTTDTKCTSVGTWSTDMPRCLGKNLLSVVWSQHRNILGGLTLCVYHVKHLLVSLSPCSPPAKRCSTLSSPSHGSLYCSHPNEEFSFGSRCNVTCEEGFVLDGTTDTECTSLGKWSSDMPHCLGKTITDMC